MRDMPGTVVGEVRIHVRVYVRFVTKRFGYNMSMRLFVGGCGLPVVSKFCIGDFCNGAPPNRAFLFRFPRCRVVKWVWAYQC